MNSIIIKITNDKFFNDQLPSMILSIKIFPIKSLFKYQHSQYCKAQVVIFQSPTHAGMIVEPAHRVYGFFGQMPTI